MDWYLPIQHFDSALGYTVPVALCAFFFGGLVKGAMGLGMPVTVVSIMCFYTDVRTSVMLVLFPILITNLWQCIRSGLWFDVYKRYWRLTISMSFFLPLTALMSVEISIQFITLSVGLVVLLFACANLMMKPISISNRLDSRAQYVTGAATGILGGLSGLVVVPLAIYFTARNLEKNLFVSSTAPFFLLGGVVLFVGYFSGGLLSDDVMVQSFLLVAPAVVGLIVGERLRLYIPDKLYRRFVLLVFFAIGVNLVHRGLLYL